MQSGLTNVEGLYLLYWCWMRQCLFWVWDGPRPQPIADEITRATSNGSLRELSIVREHDYLVSHSQIELVEWVAVTHFDFDIDKLSVYISWLHISLIDRRLLDLSVSFLLLAGLGYIVAVFWTYLKRQWKLKPWRCLWLWCPFWLCFAVPAVFLFSQVRR